MTFEEEYTFLKKEAKELFDKEDEESEPPKSHSVVRRALRCIKKLITEVKPYKEYKNLEEQGLLLRLPVKVGDTVYRIENGKITQTKITKYDIYADGSIWFSFSTSLSLPISKFKTCIFLTQAEAEQKLKEMESD